MLGGIDGIAEGGATRRGFVGGLAVAGATAVLPGAMGPDAASAAPLPCAPRPPALRRTSIVLAPDGSTVWTNDLGATTITGFRTRDLVAVASIDVGAPPQALALSPDGREALVATGLYRHAELVVVDLARRAVVRRIGVPGPAGEVAYDADGRRAHVVGGLRNGLLITVDPRAGRVLRRIRIGRVPRGLALAGDGESAVVALNGDGAVAVVPLHAAAPVRRIATAPFPYLVAMAPGDRRAYVTHNGFGDRRVTAVDLRHGRVARAFAVGPEPAGLAVAGSSVVVAERGAGGISVVDARTGRRQLTATGGRPRALALRGRRAFAVDEQTGAVSSVRLRGGR